MMPTASPLFPLNAIIDADVADAHGWDPVALARAYLAGGARFLQVRAKTAGSAWLLDTCEAIVAAARPAGAIVIVNDRADVARLAEAAGVHVGQTDLSPADVRTIVGPDAIVGLSTHSEAQVDAAQDQPASYIAVGPVFGTGTKETGMDPVGLELVRYAVARERTGGRRPVVAIGGITLERAADVLAAGASSAAVISDLFAGGDPEARVRAYVERLSPGRPV
jgi:thiamine-phosphate pyrophosphorylase